MRFSETNVAGAFLIDLTRHEDERGWFARSFCVDEFRAQGLPTNFPQHNFSFNAHCGTVRGMHLLKSPCEEPKIVRCTRGAIYDVILDLRPRSKTYRLWAAEELTAENGKALYVPSGCAHGFQTQRDDSDVFYMNGILYSPGNETGVRYNDPAFGISWPLPVSVISSRDLSFPDFADL